ncbi:class I SAM-dependent methyltransferase [Sansalvadorimonas verongulae]|uniref:class I SAM-dependent methyltransferase n=1 Tax=Sansalvadorimonas verongulae TaxID=2172824 RepID=UPI0012BCFC13|nr:class I SAM-dependent methyltransferase [Sansalvadorimonas verongulae]MTI13443.1 class I SAM-dependent methyltransferase [Sansalvadorimonas verongulae]
MSSQTNPSRLLLRNSSELDVKRLLLVMPPADSVVADLGSELPSTDISVFTTVCESAQTAGRSLPGNKVVYTHDVAQLQGAFEAIVVFLQKSKPLMDAMLGQLCPKLAEGGMLWLVGENGTGIKSWKKRLGQWGDIDIAFNGCHSGLLALLPDDTVRSPAPALKETAFSVGVAGTEITVRTLPGVFSHGRLDVGSRLLLETLAKENIRGQILDFGCGAGVIGSWLAMRHNRCRSTLLDTDAMALESARRTLEANNIEGGKVIASHGLSELKGRYDWIISNPPFHEGVKTRYDVTEQFLKDCKNHLCKGGQLRIVANSFLKYRPLIEDAFGHCEELAKGQGFTVYGATLSGSFQPVYRNRSI